MGNDESLASWIQKVQGFCEDRDWDQFHNPKELAIGLITEAAELLEHFRFKSEKEMRELMSSAEKTKVEHEVADCLFFILRFAQMNSINLDAALKNKMALNAARYPVEKVKGRNAKYTEI